MFACDLFLFDGSVVWEYLTEDWQDNMNRPKARDKVTCMECRSKFDYVRKRMPEISMRNRKVIRAQRKEAHGTLSKEVNAG